jgi:hypothetical protein
LFHALSWLKGKENYPGVGHIILRLLVRAGARHEVVEAAISWLDHHVDRAGAAEVLGELLSMAQNRTQIVDSTIGWFVDTMEARDLSTYRYLIVTYDTFKILSKTMAWLLLHGTPTQVVTLLKTFIPLAHERGGFVNEAAEWLRENLDKPGSIQLVSILLLTTPLRDLTTTTLDWLAAISDDKETDEVLSSLRSVARVRQQVREHILEWGSSHTESAKASELVTRLLEREEAEWANGSGLD